MDIFNTIVIQIMSPHPQKKEKHSKIFNHSSLCINIYLYFLRKLTTFIFYVHYGFKCPQNSIYDFFSVFRFDLIFPMDFFWAAMIIGSIVLINWVLYNILFFSPAVIFQKVCEYGSPLLPYFCNPDHLLSPSQSLRSHPFIQTPYTVGSIFIYLLT